MDPGQQHVGTLAGEWEPMLHQHVDLLEPRLAQVVGEHGQGVPPGAAFRVARDAETLMMQVVGQSGLQPARFARHTDELDSATTQRFHQRSPEQHELTCGGTCPDAG